MERELVRAILADEAVIALTGNDRAARLDLLDRTEMLLIRSQCRIVRIHGVPGRPLDLRTAMDQVVGEGFAGADRVERFFEEIALPVGQERRIVLIVDDAQTITSDLLSYLALIRPTTVGLDQRLQLILAGEPAMWDRLPAAGNLAADKIATRLVMADSVPISKMLPMPETPPTDGYEVLRYRLAEQHRRKQEIGGVASRGARRMLTIVLAVVILSAAALLWGYMPELQASIRQ